MSSMLRVKLVGEMEVKGILQDTAKDLPSETQKACEMACFVFESRAKWYASGNAGGPNVDTGFLRSSITTNAIENGAEVGPHADYASDVEFGTAHSSPYPFMRPAFDTEQDAALKVLREYLGPKIFVSSKKGESFSW